MSPEDLPLDPLKVPLYGTRLIEASAGTGKTHTISTLYLRALLERGLDVSQLLVVTFTKAATEELRGRIRTRLRGALAFLDGRGELDPVVRAVLSAERPADRVRRQLSDCLTMMDEAAIFTIHGFCQRTLRDNAFESGALFDLELHGDDVAEKLELFRDFWRLWLGAASSQLTTWLLKRWRTPEQLAATLQAVPMTRVVMMRDAVDPVALAEREDALRSQLTELARVWLADKAQISSLIRPGGGLKGQIYSAPAVARAVESMDRFLEADDPAGSLPEKQELFTNGKLQASTKKGFEPPEHLFFSMWTRFGPAAGELGRMREQHFLGEAVRYVRNRIMEAEENDSSVSYDALLTRVFKALGARRGAALAAAIRGRYPVAMVDEFQDTDDVQYGVFARVYADRPETALFLIGDPKQAIYGFRGADVFTYIKAAGDAATGGGRYTLPTNWRSTAALVRAVNTVFSRVPAPFVFEHEIPFSDVESAGVADREPLFVADDDTPPLCLWWLPRSVAVGGDDTKAIPKGWARARLAVVTANEIARLLSLSRARRALVGNRPLDAGDIAVLVRDRFEAEPIREALQAVGVSSVYLSRDSVFQSEEALDLHRVLRAMAAPGSDQAVRAALSTRIVGYDMAGIAAAEGDEAAWDGIVRQFFDGHDDWTRGDLLGALYRIFADNGVVARFRNLPNGERRLTNLSQLAELLSQQSAAKPGADRLLRWMAEQCSGRALGRDEEELRLESDEGLVKIVTLHSSKGLEFPIVFLPFSWAARPVDGKNPVMYHARHQRVVDLCPAGDSESVKAADRERLAEEVRLLYVALTRAIHRCYVGWGGVLDADRSAMAHLLHRDADDPGAGPKRSDADLLADLNELQCHSAGSIGVRAIEEIEPEPVIANAVRSGRFAPRPFHAAVERDFRVTSFSALVRARDEGEDHPERDDRVLAEPELTACSEDAAFRLPRGPRAGSVLHAVFEQIDFPTARGDSLRASVDSILLRYGMDVSHSADVVELVTNVLDTRLEGQSALRLRAVRRPSRRDELEFHFPLGRLDVDGLRSVLTQRSRFQGTPAALRFEQLRGFMRGFMDLVFEFDGRVYLVDYKSNHLGNSLHDYDHAGIANAMVQHHYDLQYLIYTVALNRYLNGRIRGYDYERHFGGVYYLFLRGMRPEFGARFGVFHDRPDQVLIGALDRVFGGPSE